MHRYYTTMTWKVLISPFMEHVISLFLLLIVVCRNTLSCIRREKAAS